MLPARHAQVTFSGESMAVVEELEGRGLLRRIDAAGEIEEVFARICRVFDDQ